MMISIKKIAKHLNIRQKRVLGKVRKMNIDIFNHDELPSLNVQGAKVLIRAYVHSRKVQSNTKTNAQKLLNALDEFEGKNNEQMKMLNLVPNDIKTKSSGRKQRNKNSSSSKMGARMLMIVQSLLKTIVQSLESIYFKFIALFVSICVQMHHTAIWYHTSVPDDSASWIAAIGFAIMLDFFVLVLTLENRLYIARTFAWLTFVSNILYFQFWVGFEYTVEAYTNAVSSIIISAIIAFILYSYTEIFVKYQKQKEG